MKGSTLDLSERQNKHVENVNKNGKKGSLSAKKVLLEHLLRKVRSINYHVDWNQFIKTIGQSKAIYKKELGKTRNFLSRVVLTVHKLHLNILRWF